MVAYSESNVEVTVELYCSSFLLQTCRRNYAARSKPSIALARGSVCLPRGARGE